MRVRIRLPSKVVDMGLLGGFPQGFLEGSFQSYSTTSFRSSLYGFLHGYLGGISYLGAPVLPFGSLTEAELQKRVTPKP